MYGPEERLARLEKAVGLLSQSPCQYEYAAALVDHGSMLRAVGREVEAVERLHEGLVIAERCGADGLVEQARSEVVACAFKGGEQKD